MTSFEAQALEVALRQMFKPEGYLNICTIRDGLKLAGIVPPQREYDALHLLHCVSWREMTPAVRDEAARLIVTWFAMPEFDPFARVIPLQRQTPPKRGLLARLSGGGQ